MKKGTKIKYCTSAYLGKEIVRSAYVLKDDGDEYIWIADTKENLDAGCGATISRSALR